MLDLHAANKSVHCGDKIVSFDKPIMTIENR